MANNPYDNQEQEPQPNPIDQAEVVEQRPLDIESATELIAGLATSNPNVAELAAAEAALREARSGDTLPAYQALERAITAVEDAQSQLPDAASSLIRVWNSLQQERGRRLPEVSLAQAAHERADIDANRNQLTAKPPTTVERTAGQAANLEAIRAHLAGIEEAGSSLLPVNPGSSASDADTTVHELAVVATGVSPDVAGLLGTQEVASDYAARLTAILQQRLAGVPEGQQLDGSVVTIIGKTNLVEAQQRLAVAGVVHGQDEIGSMPFDKFADYIGIELPPNYAQKVRLTAEAGSADSSPAVAA